MYKKNLTEDLRLRLTKTDMDFLRDLSEKRGMSISECIRYLIGEYRRSIEILDALNGMKVLAENMGKKEGKLSNGDTETDINDKL